MNCNRNAYLIIARTLVNSIIQLCLMSVSCYIPMYVCMCPCGCRALACTDLDCRDLVSVCQFGCSYWATLPTVGCNKKQQQQLKTEDWRELHRKAAPIWKLILQPETGETGANVWPSVAISQAFLMGWHWLVALILIRCCTLHKIGDLEGICHCCCCCCCVWPI